MDTPTQTPNAARDAGQKKKGMSKFGEILCSLSMTIVMALVIAILALGGIGAMTIYDKYWGNNYIADYTYGYDTHSPENYLYKATHRLEGYVISEATDKSPSGILQVAFDLRQFPEVVRDSRIKPGVWFTVDKDGKPTLINPGGYIKTSR